MDFVPEGPGFKSNSALAFSSSFFILPLMSQKIWLEARSEGGSNYSLGTSEGFNRGVGELTGKEVASDSAQ